MDNHVELRDLRFVVALAEWRSFTAAAESLHISQSALSRAVSDIENRLGVRLFNRTTRSVEPTPVGSELIRVAHAMLHDTGRSMREFGLFLDGQNGVVRVAALPSVAATVLPRLLASLRETRPGIVVEVDDTLAHDATERLIAGHVDYAITADDSIPDGAVFTPLFTDRFHAVFRSDHALHGRDAVSWREFADEPAVRFGQSSSLRRLTDKTLRDLDLIVNQAAEAQNIAVIAGLVSVGMGVAAAPAIVLPLMEFARLESAELIHPMVERTLGLVSIEGRSMTPAAHAFAEALRARF